MSVSSIKLNTPGEVINCLTKIPYGGFVKIEGETSFRPMVGNIPNEKVTDVIFKAKTGFSEGTMFELLKKCPKLSNIVEVLENQTMQVFEIPKYPKFRQMLIKVFEKKAKGEHIPLTLKIPDFLCKTLKLTK